MLDEALSSMSRFKIHGFDSHTSTRHARHEVNSGRSNVEPSTQRRPNVDVEPLVTNGRKFPGEA
jgi:hypothetical protein